MDVLAELASWHASDLMDSSNREPSHLAWWRILSARRGLLLVNKSQQDTPPFSFHSTEHDFRL